MEKLAPWLREEGYYALAVEKADAFLPLLDSRDRIYTALVTDEGSDENALKEGVTTLRALSHEVPIVVTTSKNTRKKEKEIRDAGIFYYHVTPMGTDDLKTALSCALEFSIQKESYIPFKVRSKK